MVLYALKGEQKTVNHRLIRKALDFTPCLFIDAANCANIHEFRDMAPERFAKLFVVQAESLYRFIPTLKQIPMLARKVRTNQVFISTFTRLFNYDDEQENMDVFVNAWAIIARLSKHNTIWAGVEKGTIHENLAKENDAKMVEVSSMGHTLWSQRMMVDLLIKELQQFGKALREDDRSVYSELLKRPLKHLGSISYASSAHVWSFLLLSIIVEQQKELQDLKDEIARLADGRLQG